MDELNTLLVQLRDTVAELERHNAKTLAHDVLAQHVAREGAQALVAEWLRLRDDEAVRRARATVRARLDEVAAVRQRVRAVGGWVIVDDVEHDDEGGYSYGSSTSVWYSFGAGWHASVGLHLFEQSGTPIALDAFCALCTPDGAQMSCTEPLSGVACHALDYLAWSYRHGFDNALSQDASLPIWSRCFHDRLDALEPFGSWFVRTHAGGTYAVVLDTPEPDPGDVVAALTERVNADTSSPSARSWSEGAERWVLEHADERITLCFSARAWSWSITSDAEP